MIHYHLEFFTASSVPISIDSYHASEIPVQTVLSKILQSNQTRLPVDRITRITIDISVPLISSAQIQYPNKSRDSTTGRYISSDSSDSSERK